MQLVLEEWGHDSSPPLPDGLSQGSKARVLSIGNVNIWGAGSFFVVGPCPLPPQSMPVAAANPICHDPRCLQALPDGSRGTESSLVKKCLPVMIILPDSITRTNPSTCVLITTKIFTDLWSLSFLTCQME